MDAMRGKFLSQLIVLVAINVAALPGWDFRVSIVASLALTLIISLALLTAPRRRSRPGRRRTSRW